MDGGGRGGLSVGWALIPIAGWGDPKKGGGLLKWEDFGDPRVFFFPHRVSRSQCLLKGTRGHPSLSQGLCS